MKILVGIKRVIDYAVHVRLKPDSSGVEKQNVKMGINPFDAIALEEAVRLKEKNVATEVVAVSIGDHSSQETLRQALAQGADRAVLVETTDVFEPINIAKILKKIAEKENPDLIILGKQAIDDDCCQTGPMLSGLLNWPQAAFISELTCKEGCLVIERETDEGIETLECQLPVVLTADLRLNEPRYASLPNIMKAKQKPLEVLTLQALGLSEQGLAAHTQILEYFLPPPRKGGAVLDSVEALVQKLNAAGVLS